MGLTTQFSLRMLFTTLTVCGMIFAILASFGAGLAIAISFILIGGIAIHVVAAVLTEVLDLVVDRTRRTPIRGRKHILMVRDVKNEDDPDANVECVVVTCDNVQLEESNHAIRFLRQPVDDDDLEALAELSHLKWLVLDNTNVSDNGLTLLHGLTRLRRLYLRGSRVTQDGVQRLRLAMPDVEVVF